VPEDLFLLGVLLLCGGKMGSDGGEVDDGPLGVSVSGGWLLVSGVWAGVSVTGVLSGLGGTEEQGDDESADQSEEEEEDDGVLDGGGVEGEGGGAVGTDVNEPQPGISGLLGLVGHGTGGQDGQGSESE